MGKHIRIKLTEVEYKIFGCLAVLEDATRKETVQKAFDDFLEMRERLARNGQSVTYRALPMEGSFVTVLITVEAHEAMRKWAERDNVRLAAVYNYAVTEFLKEQDLNLNMELT